jgi:hypothetical protein
LFSVRERLGAILGLDRAAGGIGSRVATLRQRLPADLAEGPPGPDPGAGPFTSLYLTENEWAAEAANATMHGILHFGQISDGHGGFRAQMAVLVKPNGVLGEAYMAAIKPFRHRIVYPALLREIGQRWPTVTGSAVAPG